MSTGDWLLLTLGVVVFTGCLVAAVWAGMTLPDMFGDRTESK